METISKETLAFLSSLKINNDRDWFAANRQKYESAKTEFETFVTAVLDVVSAEEPILKGLEAKSCIFRINRDTRFSNDKSPYKTNMGAFIVRGGRKNGDKYPGYYIHIEPGACMLAGGAYMPPAPWLNAIREKISDNYADFLDIISEKKFVTHFSGLSGEKLRKAPKGFETDHPAIEILKHKSYLAVNEISDKKVTGADYLTYVIDNIRAMRPLNNFLTIV